MVMMSTAYLQTRKKWCTVRRLNMVE